MGTGSISSIESVAAVVCASLLVVALYIFSAGHKPGQNATSSSTRDPSEIAHARQEVSNRAPSSPATSALTTSVKVSGPGDTSRQHASLFSEINEAYVAGKGWQEAPPPKKIVGRTSDIFVAHHRHAATGSVLERATWIELRDERLVVYLRKVVPAYTGLYDSKPGMDSRDIYLNRSEILGRSEDLSHEGCKDTLVKLVNYVDDLFRIVEEKKRELPEGTIVWALLWWIFSTGSDVETRHDLHERLMSFTIDSWQYTMDERGRAFLISGHFYQWSGSSFAKMDIVRKIPEFRDIRLISALDFWPLTKDRKLVLSERGRSYATRFSAICHADYVGSFYTRVLSGASRVSGTGQVMIDVTGFRKANPALDTWSDDVNARSDWGRKRHEGTVEKVYCPPERFYLLPPSIHGFSLVAKRWGEFTIDQLSEIRWTGAAFEHLVIPDTYRRIVRSLVDVHTGSLGSRLVSDVVQGKGEGLIIALHGRPGTGKVELAEHPTLTAEAVAEHLRTPLYIVSAGELGTSVTALERKLGEVLELATAWNAVLLIDEADIFLEKRTNAQLERNALVGVFLRLLEYFSGVLILTTNRLEDFDPAFASRFSVTLPFRDLTLSSRATLWQKFINLARPEMSEEAIQAEFDVNFLASVQINGRMIKQSLRTAQALALVDGHQLRMEHLREVMELATAEQYLDSK